MAARLGRSARRAWLLAHVAVSVGWMGAGATNLALAATALVAPRGDLPAIAAYRAVELVDTWIVIPAAFGTLGTGLVVSVGTTWGLTRHWWVLAKFALTVAVIVFATLGIGVWVERSLALTGSGRPSDVAAALVVGAAGNIVAFLVMTALSIYKPRGTTPWSTPGRRASTGRAGRIRGRRGR